MLIYNINPYIISMVRRRPFFRKGKHPLYYKLRNAKHPFLSMFWDGANDEFDGIWERASVDIVGANGKVLKVIECRSYAEADRIIAEINARLADFVSKTRPQ